MPNLKIYDFTKRNQWENFKKRMTSPQEKKLVEFMETMEKQINLLTAYIHNMEIQQAKAEAKAVEVNKEEES